MRWVERSRKSIASMLKAGQMASAMHKKTHYIINTHTHKKKYENTAVARSAVENVDSFALGVTEVVGTAWL